MLPAKLFAGLALAFSICAGFAKLFSPPSMDIGVRGEYFSFGPFLVPLFCAVTCANFAVLYYAAARIFQARWNRTLSTLHFSLSVCFGVSGTLFYLMSTRVENHPNGEAGLLWLFALLLVGILSFVASYVVFGINLILVSVQVVRARFATR
jgi:hypothetical protein